MNKGLIEHFEMLTDPRVDRTKRYPLIEIILLIIAGTVSGCDGWKSLKDFGEAKLDWLRKFLPYKDGIPVDDTLARVMRKKADYILALKGNQGNLHVEVTDFFKTALAADFKQVQHDYFEEHDAGHGRIEFRQCWAIKPCVDSFPSFKKWPDLKSLIMIKARREFKDGLAQDTDFILHLLHRMQRKH